MSESDFWNSSLSKIIEIAEVHIRVNKLDGKNAKPKKAQNSNYESNTKITELKCLD